MSEQAGRAPRRKRVRPYPLHELPRLLGVQIDLARALWQHLGPVLDATGRAGALEEAIGGPLTVIAREPYLFPPGEAEARVQGGVIVELELLGAAPRPLLLAIDETLCERLDLDEEAIGPLLRGALAGAPARVGGPCLPEEVGEVLGTGPAMAMDLQLGTPAGPGWARLLCRADLRLGAAAAPTGPALMRLWLRRGRLADVPVTLAIEAGTSTLRNDEVADLTAGDVVLLDHFGPRPVVGGPVQLRLRGGAFPAHLDGEGVTLLGPFELSGTENMAHEERVRGAEPAADGDKERILRELPVLVTCEIGRVTMTGREVLELRPGAVLPVGRPLAGPVDLCAGGRVIARGELVDVEGEIGVRVTEVFDDPAG